MKSLFSMRGRSLWTFFAFYAIVAVISLLAIAIFATSTFREFFKSYVIETIESKVTIVASVLDDDAFKTADRNLCLTLAQSYRAEIGLYDLNGSPICRSDSWGILPGEEPLVREVLDSDTEFANYSEFNGSIEVVHAVARVGSSETPLGVVRVSLPLDKVDKYLSTVFFRLLGVGVLVTALVIAVSVVFFRRIAVPLKEMRLGAHLFARGQFNRELPNYEVKEIAELAVAMNKMGNQLKHLEEVRRDFVANVSHELKTPITSIKGFVETLLEGALDDKQDLQRFLQIISRQSERLTAIIEDLLTLARLESERRDDLLIIQEQNLRFALEAAMDVCRQNAESKSISLELVCEPVFMVAFDRSLLEQAVINLVDNAIKYSGSKSRVVISTEHTATNVSVRVTDEGPGISNEHLPRLFERFYRVDKARSRSQGGTGLGLAIVKHVASAHRGRVTVESKVGQGTSFTITIPRAPS